MNRKAFRILTLCGFLFIIIVFSANTCVLVQNEENNKYSLNVRNDSSFPIKMIVWGVKQEALENGGSTLYYVSPGSAIDAVYQSSPEMWVDIRGTDKFPFIMPSSGLNVMITNSDIGISISSEK
jgi:hypothetical protein